MGLFDFLRRGKEGISELIRELKRIRRLRKEGNELCEELMEKIKKRLNKDTTYRLLDAIGNMMSKNSLKEKKQILDDIKKDISTSPIEKEFNGLLIRIGENYNDQSTRQVEFKKKVELIIGS